MLKYISRPIRTLSGISHYVHLHVANNRINRGATHKIITVPENANIILAQALRDREKLQATKEVFRPRAYSVNLLPKLDFSTLLSKPASRLSDDVSLAVEELCPSTLSPKPLEPRCSCSLELLLMKNILTARRLFITCIYAKTGRYFGSNFSQCEGIRQMT